MKNLALTTALLCCTLFVVSQDVQPIVNSNIHEGKLLTNSQGHLPKSLGDTIWQNNFDNPVDWTIDNNGISAPAAGWDINSTVDGWYFTNPVASPSGGNFAELGNGDDPNTAAAIGVTYSLTLSSPIDIVALGGSQFVNLEFLQYGARLNDVQRFQISEDGTNFITVGDNSDKDVFTNNGGAPYDNPDLVRVNLGQYLSANPTQVWIRFQWTSAYPNNTSNAAWLTYGWMIDDVKITTLADNDVLTSGLYYGTNDLHYYQIPENQVAPIDFTVKVENNGLNAQEGVALQDRKSVV